jgi:hypothetical protein
MKKIFLIMFLLLAGTFGLSGTSQAYTNVSFSIGFHDALAPYGTWFNYSNYGNCWRPNVYAGWSPYTEGHWAYTSYGPMWDSPEPYGWATYHYGQWVYSASYGWIWVPGYDYYPSRVSWAYGNDYIAWSPIYPAPSYANVNLWFGIDHNHWGYNDYRNVILRGDRVRPLFERRAIQIRNTRLDRRDFERFARRPIQVVPVEQRTVRADNRQMRLVVPRDRAQVVERELTRAQKQRIADNRNDRFNDRDNRNERFKASDRDNRNNRYNANDRNSRNDKIVERRDSKGNRVYENSKHNREFEARDNSNDRRSNREVTTRYSGKKIISKPSTKNSNYNHKSSSYNNHKSSSNYYHKSSQQIPRNMASRENDRSRSFSSKSSTHEVSRREIVRQSPQKHNEISGKYSSSSHRPEMRQSSKQVREVSRKEVHSNQAKANSHNQNRKPQKKH